MLNVTSRTEKLPIMLEDVKLHSRVLHDVEDELLEAYVKDAIELIERETDRTLVDTTYELVLDCFPSCRIMLPKPPLRSVTSIEYYDAANELQTLDSAEYYTMAPTSQQGYVQPVDHYWPSTYWRPDAVTITYRAGYSTLPHRAMQLIRIKAAASNEHREAEIVGTISTPLKLGWDRGIAALKWGKYR